MSFSMEQKREIAEQVKKNACCRRAMLYGMLAAKGECTDGTVALTANLGDALDLTRRLILEFFGREVTSATREKGGRTHTLVFSSASATQMLTDMIAEARIDVPCRCDGCRSAFLQGLFLAAGRVSDPSKQYCLEFSLGERADMFWNVLGHMGLYLKISRKKNECVLYTKNSTTVEDFFALAGMNTTAFALMNSKIKSEIRNNVNRVANCETNNIGKAVAASGKHIQAISELERLGLLSSLPDELERTARLRLTYRDLSLAELAAVSVPPISKSGISHRMQRIMDFYRSSCGEGNE